MKITFKVAIFLLFIQASFAQKTLSPDEIYDKLSKSLVSIEVKPVDGGSNACTGFVWQKPDQVITSLHAMHPGSKIFVKYFNDLRNLREFEAIKVYKDADLVLLKLKKGQPSPPHVDPIKDINIEPIIAETNIYSLGYPSGAKSASSRVLKKGWIQNAPPETLESFLPKAYVEILKDHEFPKVDLDIIYVQGSLLPGYSGAPCMDASGNLVGIGDGGLERGAANVSWLIPVKFLSTLETSTDDQLPEALATSIHFCATVPLKKNTKGQTQEPDSLDEQKDIHAPVVSPDFEFYFIKNRSLQEMYESSGNDYNLIQLLYQMKNEFKVNIDPQKLRFDVYEDVNSGIVLAIPEGEYLYYHAADHHFQVNRREGSNVNILYNGIPGDYSNIKIEDELDKTFRWLLDSMQVYWKVKNFQIDDNYTRIYDFYDNPNIPYDDGRKVANVMMKSEPVMDSDGKGFSTVYLYVTMLMAKDKTFMSVASYKLSNDKLTEVQATGLDCYDSTPSDDCLYFETFIKAFCAAHLTTFAF